MKKKLKDVTLLGIDCVDIDRLILAAEICQEQFEFAEVKLLTSLKSDNKHIVPIDPITSIEDYSYFAIAKLNEHVTTSHVLIIQYDGFILNPKAWSDEFLNYDYIGAPWLVNDWSVKTFDLPKELIGKMVIGNGGFSLRTKKFLKTCAELAQQNAFAKYQPEDVALCVWNRNLMESHDFHFAPVEMAKQFSFEGENDDSKRWNGAFGFHGLRWTDISKWESEHPEYEINVEQNTIRRAS